MTATDELRRLLDERGVEHRADDAKTIKATHWKFRGHASAMFTEYDDDETVLVTSGATWTPAQAVEATLGRGTCKMRSAEGSFHAVNRPVYFCECGAFCTDYTDATTYYKPRYCPNCGREVVDA